MFGKKLTRYNYLVIHKGSTHLGADLYIGELLERGKYKLSCIKVSKKGVYEEVKEVIWTNY